MAEMKEKMHVFFQKNTGKQIKIAIVLLLLAFTLLLFSKLSDNGKTTSAQETKVGITYNDQETKLAYMLQNINGVGETEVLLTYDKSGDIVGVLVFAEGASDPAVRLQIKRALQTAIVMKNENIRIYEKKSQ